MPHLSYNWLTLSVLLCSTKAEFSGTGRAIIDDLPFLPHSESPLSPDLKTAFLRSALLLDHKHTLF